MRVVEFLRCLSARQHDWMTSRARPGYVTCARCRTRRKMNAEERELRGVNKG